MFLLGGVFIIWGPILTEGAGALLANIFDKDGISKSPYSLFLHDPYARINLPYIIA